MEMNLPVIKLETRNLTKKFSATEDVYKRQRRALRCFWYLIPFFQPPIRKSKTSIAPSLISLYSSV